MAQVDRDHVEDECSEAAKEELYKEAEEQLAQLQMLQDAIVLSEPDQRDNAQDQSVNRLIETDAELQLWLSMEPTLLAKHPELLLHVGTEEMHKLCSDLEMIVSCCQAKKDTLTETLKCEEKWLQEKKEVLVAAADHVEKLRLENEKITTHSVLQDTKDKIEKMKRYQERLMDTLTLVLEQHFPLPQQANAGKKKTNKKTPEDHEDLLPLNEILERLMNKTVETPHDPYVTIDDTFWKPYVEVLLRYSIAVRHPEDSLKIRMENVY